jgi:hypothetical protein
VVRRRIAGKLKEFGMVSFDKDLSDEDAASIRAYVMPDQPVP